MLEFINTEISACNKINYFYGLSLHVGLSGRVSPVTSTSTGGKPCSEVWDHHRIAICISHRLNMLWELCIYPDNTWFVGEERHFAVSINMCRCLCVSVWMFVTALTALSLIRELCLERNICWRSATSSSDVVAEVRHSISDLILTYCKELRGDHEILDSGAVL